MNNVPSPTIRRRAFLAAMAAIPAGSAFAARSKLERIMVQGRPQDTGSLYKFQNIMPALDALGGVRKMRCRAPINNTPGWNSYSRLAKAGVKFCFTLPIREPSVLIADLLAFVRGHPASIWAIEFPNEPDLNPVTYAGLSDKRLGARHGSAPALMKFCQDITLLLSQTAELNSIPRIAFNDWMPEEQRPLTQFANSHIYPKPGSAPDGWRKNWTSLLAASGKRQGVITEWGRTTGGGPNNIVAPPVTLDKQAELLAADIKSILAEPTVAAVSLYELLSWPGSGEQENFGLFNADLTPRPIVHAIRTIVA